MVEEGLAGRGQFDATRAAAHQGSADFLFEIPDLPAQRRLRGMELLLGSHRQAAGIGHGDEVAQVPKLHRDLPYLAGMEPAYKVFFSSASRHYSKRTLTRGLPDGQGASRLRKQRRAHGHSSIAAAASGSDDGRPRRRSAISRQ